MSVQVFNGILLALSLMMAQPGLAMERQLPHKAVKVMPSTALNLGWLGNKMRSLFVGIRLDINLNINLTQKTAAQEEQGTKLPGSRFEHDFSRVPVHAKAPASAGKPIILKPSSPARLGYDARPTLPLLVAPSGGALMVR